MMNSTSLTAFDFFLVKIFSSNVGSGSYIILLDPNRWKLKLETNTSMSTSYKEKSSDHVFLIDVGQNSQSCHHLLSTNPTIVTSSQSTCLCIRQSDTFIYFIYLFIFSLWISFRFLFSCHEKKLQI